MEHVILKNGAGETISIQGTTSVSIKTQGGKFNTSTGLSDVCATSATDFTRWRGTISMIRVVKGKDSISSITLTSTESVYITCWDSNFNYLGYVQDKSALKDNTTYIKIYLHSSTDYTKFDNIKASFDLFYPYKEIKNSATLETILPFAFQVQVINDNEESSNETYNGINEITYDNGFIVLPSNYTPVGKPVPLVLFVHGTHQHDWGSTAASSDYYAELFKFLSYNGYAVADCCGVTAKYYFGETTEGQMKSNPLGLSCFIQMYDYLMKNYNLKSDGCYVMGKSAGGQCSILLGYTQLPVRAIAEISPSVSTVSEDARRCSTISLNFCLRRFGFENPNVQRLSDTTYDWSESDRAYVLENIEKFRGYEPLFAGSDLDMYAVTQEMFKTRYDEVDNDAVWALINAGKKYQPCPIKIWQSEYDKATPIYYTRMYKKLVDNGNGLCVIRTVPHVDGGDGHMDAENTTRINYATKHNGEVSTPYAYAEIVDWFNRW